MIEKKSFLTSLLFLNMLFVLSPKSKVYDLKPMKPFDFCVASFSSAPPNSSLHLFLRFGYIKCILLYIIEHALMESKNTPEQRAQLSHARNVLSKESYPFLSGFPIAYKILDASSECGQQLDEERRNYQSLHQK